MIAGVDLCGVSEEGWCWSGDCRLCLALREGLIGDGLGVRQHEMTALELAIQRGKHGAAALLSEVRGS